MIDAKESVKELEMLKGFHEKIIDESTKVSEIQAHKGCLVAIDHAIRVIEDQEERIAIMAEGMKELPKEQEAVKPILIHEGRNKYFNDYACPYCDNEVVYEQNYCSECGVPFLWEGR